MPNLYLIAGHGNGDPGACSGGYSEATQVRELAKRIKELAANTGEVTIHDMSRNAYAQGDLNTLNVPKGTMVLELHRDSASSAARGAHVIIKDGFKADDFDTKLAHNLSSIFPGRSQIIVGRSNLANVNRAAKRGINYRLAEVGFITSVTDRTIWNDRLDDIARAVLDAAGIASKGAAPAPEPVIKTKPKGDHRPGGFEVFRVYNPNTGEHFYTTHRAERDNLVRAGWKDEGTAWRTPSSGAPIYRLVNPWSGFHMFTASEGEKNNLVNAGWYYEGVAAWNGTATGKPVYRLYNPNAGQHFFTTSAAERDNVKRAGWKDEGIAFRTV